MYSTFIVARLSLAVSLEVDGFVVVRGYAVYGEQKGQRV